MGINKKDLSIFDRLGFAHRVASEPLESWFSYRSSDELREDLVHMVPDRFHGRIDEFAYLYGMHSSAMDELRRRTEFFFALLDGPEKVPAELLEKVGVEKLGIRAAVASHLAFERAQELFVKMEAMPEEFLRYVFSGMKNGFSNIEKFGLTVTNYCSPCERTGVCVCERGDRNPPYAHSCLGGNDAILLLPETERPDGFIAAMVEAFPSDVPGLVASSK